MLGQNPLAVWGPPGFIISIMGVVIRYLYLELKSERSARIDDLKGFQTQATQLAKESAQKEEILYNKIEAARNGGR